MTSEAVICLYDYTAKRDVELSFRRDDIIVVLKKRESGWWLGSLRGTVGKFPRNLTKLITKDESEDSDEPANDDEDDALEDMFRRLKLAKGSSSTSVVAATAGVTAASATSAALNSASEKRVGKSKSSSTTRSSSSSSSSKSSVTEDVKQAISELVDAGEIKKSDKGDKLERQRRERDEKLGGKSRSRKSVAGTRMHATVNVTSKSAAPSSISSTRSGSVAPLMSLHMAASTPSIASAPIAGSDVRQRSSSISTRNRANSLSRKDDAASGAAMAGAAAAAGAAPALSDALAALPHKGSASSLSASPAVPALSAQLSMKSSGKAVSTKALAVFTYVPEDNEHAVAFSKGEIITVLRELTADWWLGRVASGTQGVFPSSYVRVIVASNKARALFAFEARRERHLSFKKGDVITVFRNDKDWWDGMCNGRFGSFPGNHVRLLKDEEAARLEAGGDDSGDDDDDTAVAVADAAASAGDLAEIKSASAAAAAAAIRASANAAPKRRADDEPLHGKKPRLFHIKGKSQILVTKTVVSARSLNDGDVFVLDTGAGRIFLWNGTYARQVERTMGYYLATRLAEEESSELVVMEKGSEPALFWDALGGFEPVLSGDEGGDDEEVSRTQLGRRVLYKVVDTAFGAPTLERVDIDTTVLERGVLQPAHAFVLDINHEVFVWAGMQASGAHKFAGMQRAEELIRDRAPHVAISWVIEGGELVFFREQFANWQDDRQMRLAEQMQLQQQMTYALQLEAGAGTAPPQQPQAASVDPLKLAVVKFNSKPKDGVKFMFKQKLCRKQAKDLARLLWQLPQINMTQLGDYLSEKADFNQSVLREFARQIDLRARAFDAALREFLQHFRLPGEAQKIDRIMECFAAHYLEQNPACRLSPDTCFVLAFSTIMLNTDLHNPAIKNKMTRDEFIKNTRHISDELSTEFLTELYDNISRHEIKMDVDAFGDQEKSGFLAKRQLAGWKRKWFVLSNNNLYYFNDKDDKNPRFILPLEALQVRKASQLGQKYCCEIFDANARLLKCCKLSGDGVLIEAKQKTLILAADTEAERDDWLAAIGQNVLANPFYEFLKRRLETKGKPPTAAAAATPDAREDAE
jgi:hypothetical protein